MKEVGVHYMELISLICATLFTGAAGYISLVEHPVRMQLEDGPALAQWGPSYARALPMQSGLAIVGGLSGFAAWYLSGRWEWIAGSVILLANWPFTLSAIMPTNKRLKAIGPGDESRLLLRKWGQLHNGRSALGAIAAAIFAAGCLQ